jgi:hypothetical protein
MVSLLLAAACSEGYSDLVDPEDPFSWVDTMRTGTYRVEERFTHPEPLQPEGWDLKLQLGCIGRGTLTIISYTKSGQIKAAGFIVRSCPDQENWTAMLFAAEGAWQHNTGFTLTTPLDPNTELSYQGHSTSTGLTAEIMASDERRKRTIGGLTATWMGEMDKAETMAIAAALGSPPDKALASLLADLPSKMIDLSLPYDCRQHDFGWTCASRPR